MNKLSIVIPSINRYDSLRKLLSDLILINKFIDEIIIVDSTDTESYIDITKEFNVIQIKSKHKNGFFQRILGAHKAKTEFIMFLDNDMELILPDKFEDIIKKLLITNDLSGIAIGFRNKLTLNSQSDIPESILTHHPILYKIKNLLTAYPNLKQGKYGFCGNRGKQPKNFEKTEWLSGGAFIARKESFLKLINWRIVDYFEYQLGMGEDPLIGYMLSKQGSLYYYPVDVFLHNDQMDSTYSSDKYKLSKRFAFSRLYLSLEKCRLDKKPYIIGYFTYYYFMFFRIAGLIINLAVNKNREKKIMLLSGTFKGFLLTFLIKFRYKISSKIDWTKIIKEHK